MPEREDSPTVEPALTIRKDRIEAEQPKTSTRKIDEVNQYLMDYNIECPKDLDYQSTYTI